MYRLQTYLLSNTISGSETRSNFTEEIKMYAVETVSLWKICGVNLTG